MRIKETIKKIWNFLIHEDSWLSFLADAVIILLLGKFVIFPLLGLALGTSYPMVAVVSGSMDHHGLDFESWWKQQGAWYEMRNITGEQFSTFYRPDGFKRGDVFVVKGISPGKLKVGDIIIYRVPSRGNPIIHRVIAVNNNTFSTKGDANTAQISFEKDVPITALKGKVIAWAPYIGWVKAWMTNVQDVVAS